ncbi:MAG: hypothetical protein AAB649_02075 [Patescibacteria group bacterium]
MLNKNSNYSFTDIIILAVGSISWVCSYLVGVEMIYLAGIYGLTFIILLAALVTFTVSSSLKKQPQKLFLANFFLLSYLALIILLTATFLYMWLYLKL